MKLDTEYALELMDKVFHDLFNALPNKPKLARSLDGQYGYRFEEKDIPQAIIQKLAFVQSSLNAAILLLDKGFVVEWGILTRTIREANEDIIFLSLAIIDKQTELHERCLKDFWEEDIEKKPNVRSREKIRKEIHDYLEEKMPYVIAILPSYEKVSRALYSVYSKFVHSTSSCIMLTYCGNPPCFYTQGIPGTLGEKSRYHYINFSIYWSLMSHILAGEACGHSNVIRELSDYCNYVKKENNLN